MTTITDPVIDRWYRDVEKDIIFKVVAIDEDTVDIQYGNGDINEFDIESWYDSTFDFIEAPDDWTAPYGGIESDDLGYSE